MKSILKKIADILQLVFGYGIFVCLFAGGFTFFGYIAAIVIGGEAGEMICEVIYKIIFPVIIKTSTIMVMLGLLVMYLKGERALDVEKRSK